MSLVINPDDHTNWINLINSLIITYGSYLFLNDRNDDEDIIRHSNSLQFMHTNDNNIIITKKSKQIKQVKSVNNKETIMSICNNTTNNNIIYDTIDKNSKNTKNDKKIEKNPKKTETNKNKNDKINISVI